MNTLVVLSALLAVAAASPSAYHTYATAHAVLPAAVSHQSRTDVISKPVITAYAAPAVVAEHAVVAAPTIVKTAPVLTAYTAPVAVPAAVSSSYRTDVISKPVVATTYAAAAPVVTQTLVKAAPAYTAYAAPAYTAYAAPSVSYSAIPAAVSSQSRTDYISKPVVSAYAAHYPAYSTYGAPLAYKQYVW